MLEALTDVQTPDETLVGGPARVISRPVRSCSTATEANRTGMRIGCWETSKMHSMWCRMRCSRRFRHWEILTAGADSGPGCSGS